MHSTPNEIQFHRSESRTRTIDTNIFSSAYENCNQVPFTTRKQHKL